MKQPIDHSTHDIRPGDLVTISPDYWVGGALNHRTYTVRRLVRLSANPEPCAVLVPADGSGFSESTWGVGWLVRVTT